MKKLQKKNPSNSVLVIFVVALLSSVFVGLASAENRGGAVTLGLWRLDEIFPHGDSIVTVDSSDQIAAILGGAHEPVLVEGKFERALAFDGNNFVYVPISFIVGFPPTPQPIYIPISPALNPQYQIKIDAWVNAQGYTNGTYNNIAVTCTRTNATWESTTRVVGLSIRGLGSEDGLFVQPGCLSGFFRTEAGDFNEIVTSKPVIPLNEWTHVTFTRTETGMHLFVDGYEQAVDVIHGSQNPVGRIMNGTEIYFGHDAMVTLDEVSITDLAPEVENMSAIDIGPNLASVIIAVAVVFAIAWILRRAIQMRVIHSRTS